ncbi:MAG: biotin/lipoyl-containing protein [Chloroflexota bacterium]
MRYEVDVGGHRRRLEVGTDGRLLIDGRAVAHDAREVVPRRLWSVVVEGRAHEVVRLGGAPERWWVGGAEVVVSVADERAAAARSDRARAGGGRHEMRAPMPGLLKALHVAEGDVVERDAAVATLEAMKMENELRAPAAGRVTRIAAAAGTKVEGGALIAVLVDEPA